MAEFEALQPKQNSSTPPKAAMPDPQAAIPKIPQTIPGPLGKDSHWVIEPIPAQTMPQVAQSPQVKKVPKAGSQGAAPHQPQKKRAPLPNKAQMPPLDMLRDSIQQLVFQKTQEQAKANQPTPQPSHSNALMGLMGDSTWQLPPNTSPEHEQQTLKAQESGGTAPLLLAGDTSGPMDLGEGGSVWIPSVQDKS